MSKRTKLQTEIEFREKALLAVFGAASTGLGLITNLLQDSDASTIAIVVAALATGTLFTITGIQWFKILRLIRRL